MQLVFLGPLAIESTGERRIDKMLTPELNPKCAESEFLDLGIETVFSRLTRSF